MTTQSHEHRHYSPSGGNVHIVETIGRGGLIVLLVVAFVALAFSVAGYFKGEAAEDRAALAEREARLAQKDAELLRATLIAHGVSADSDQLKREK